MATLPIHLEVEDVAVGPVMIALRRMPGIIKMDVKLDDVPPRPARQPGEPKEGQAQQIMRYLVSNGGGPFPSEEVYGALGISKNSFSTAITKLIAARAVKRTGRGIYELSDKARRELLPGAPVMKLLPAPAKAATKTVAKTAKVKKAKVSKKNGHAIRKARAKPGAAWAALSVVLQDGPLRRMEVAERLDTHGVSSNSVSGILERAERGKLIKNNGNGWELTEKGRQQAAEAGA